MFKQDGGSKEKCNGVVADYFSQKKNNLNKIFGFTDNRPKSVAQRKLQKIENNATTNPVLQRIIDEVYINIIFYPSLLRQRKFHQTMLLFWIRCI